MRKLLPLFFILIYCNSRGQQFGGNPPAVKWKQINTDTVRVIFPNGLDTSAQRVATIVHYLAQQKPGSLGDQLKKINIVLQNQTTVANGYVSLGPFRSEFFLTPDADNLSEGSISWKDQLAIHEYRHVQQFNNFNHGLSKLMKVLSGEDGYSLAINAAIPDWFYEGDAVFNETVVSRQGRGRLPRFLNAYPALWKAGKDYSWMKLRNGSSKDYVPNHYYLGYLLVNYGREKYGEDFWTKVTRDASAFKGLFYPFQKAVKKYAGVDYETFRKQAFDHYKQLLVSQNSPGEFIFPVNKHFVENYYYPFRISADSLLYLKSTYRHRPAFFIKDSKGEHQLRIRDISIDEQYSYRNGKIVYAAYESDARWSWKDYTVIMLIDVTTKEQKTITHHTKYFTPDISPDGTRIAAIQNSADGKSSLHILDAGTGTFITAIQSHDIELYTDPEFIDNDKLVVAVRLRDGKMALAMAEISTGVTSRLTIPSYNVLGYPCVNGDRVYFTASYGGNDDIFFVQLSDQKVFRVISGGEGNYFPNAAAGKISWSAFTAEGNLLKQINESDLQPTPVFEEEIVGLKEKFPVSANGTADILNDKLPERNFPVKRYPKSKNIFNFHSWRPYYSDPVFTYSIYGENILNTLQSELYYLYNRSERTNAIGISELYGAWFPYINLGAEYTFDRQEEMGTRTRQWAQLDSRLGLILPLHFTSGRTFKNLSLGTYYILRNEFNKGFYKDSLGNTSFSYLLHSLSWSQQVSRALQHVYPRTGYSFVINHRHAITRYDGYQYIGSASLYLPGIIANQNLIFSGAFQQRDTLGQVSFANRFSYSRGFTGRYFSRMWRLSVNYHAPVFYPDWGFGNILYIQNLRLNGFYDYTKVYSRDKKQTREQRSIGGELFADTKWWNQYPLTFGIRVSYLLDPDQFDGRKGTVVEFILPVSIIPR